MKVTITKKKTETEELVVYPPAAFKRSYCDGHFTDYNLILEDRIVSITEYGKHSNDINDVTFNNHRNVEQASDILSEPNVEEITLQEFREALNRVIKETVIEF